MTDDQYDFGITLERTLHTHVVVGRSTAYRMRVSVVSAYGVDPNIFMYRRIGGAGVGDAARDVFVSVCSPVDIEEYPVAEPGATGMYYRMADIDLLARTPDELDEVWRLIQLDRNELVRTLQALQTVTGTQISSFGRTSDGSL